MNKGTKLKKLRKSGFRAKIKTTSGRRILKSKIRKHKHKISLT